MKGFQSPREISMPPGALVFGGCDRCSVKSETETVPFLLPPRVTYTLSMRRRAFGRVFLIIVDVIHLIL
jgi:hypothetical protein